MNISRYSFALGLAAAAAFITASAQAQTPTIIITAPYTIAKPGKYQLNADLFYAGIASKFSPIINVAASNVTLDFNGHYISGPSNSPATQVVGVYAEERGNLTIKNGTIAFCSTGIYFKGNGTSSSHNINQRVENMLVTYCYGDGMTAYQVNGGEIRNCRISFIGGGTDFADSRGIFSLYCTGLQFNNNVITNVSTVNAGGHAYGIVGSAGSFAVGNTVSNCETGIAGVKRQKNLTIACTTPYVGGTDAGLNN